MLNTTKVYRTLGKMPMYLGMEIPDLTAVIGLFVVAIVVTMLFFHRTLIFGFPAPLVVGIATILLSYGSLSAFKYGKPKGYLRDLLASIGSPRSYTATARDRVLTRPYIK